MQRSAASFTDWTLASIYLVSRAMCCGSLPGFRKETFVAEAFCERHHDLVMFCDFLPLFKAWAALSTLGMLINVIVVTSCVDHTLNIMCFMSGGLEIYDNSLAGLCLFVCAWLGGPNFQKHLWSVWVMSCWSGNHGLIKLYRVDQAVQEIQSWLRESINMISVDCACVQF